MCQLNPKEEEILQQIRDASYEALRGKDNNGIPFLKHIFQLHYKIFGETCSNCPGKITGYIQKLKNFNTTIKMEIIKSEYQLQEGVIIPVAGTSEAYSNHNLTDEVAIKLLVQNPNRKSLFNKLPENVDELIEAYVEEIEVDEEDNLVTVGENKITIEEAITLLDLINVKSKATTVTGVQKKIAELNPEQSKEFNVLVFDLVSKKQLLTEGEKTIEELKADYEVAFNAYHGLEAEGTEEEKATALQVLEIAESTLVAAENKINKVE
jgi:hypothetical protein